MRRSLSDSPEGLSVDTDQRTSAGDSSRQEVKVSDESLDEGSITAYQRKRWTLLTSPSTLNAAEDDTNSAQLLDDLLAGYEPLSPTYKSVYEEALTPVLSVENTAPPVRPFLKPLLIPTDRPKETSAPYQAIEISSSLINTQKTGDAFLFTNPTLQSTIQNIADNRACFKDISGIVQNLNKQISRFREYEKHIEQCPSPLDLDDFGSCSQELAQKMKVVKECILRMEQRKGKSKPSAEQSATPTDLLADLEKLVRDRNSGRLAAAKSLDRFLRNMELSVGLREARQRELESEAATMAAPNLLPSNIPTFDESVSEFNNWQGEVAGILGEQMEHTNNIMQQLTQAVKAETHLFREHASLIARGPVLVAQLVQARQVHRHSKHDSREVAQEAYNYRAIQRYLTHTALEMKRMPAAEEVLRVVGQVKEIRKKNQDIKQKLVAARKRSSSPAQSSVEADADAIKQRRELPILRKQVAALAQRELLLIQQLNAFASKEYPELRTFDLCSPEMSAVTDDKLPTSGNLESPCSPMYLDMIPRNAAQTLYIVRTITTKKAVKKCKHVNVEDQSDMAYCKAIAEELGKCDHSSLAQVTTFWIEDGTPYVEMPFYAGDTFREWAFKNIPTATVSQAREIFEAILSAIAYLHQHGLVHGSLSLDNVIMIEKGCDNNAVEKHVPILCGYNFHRRRLASDDHGVPGTIPETIATASQDIWDYGYILCEALSTANVPPDIDERGNAIIPKMVSRLNSRHLQQFLQQCLSREVERRPPADVALIHPYFTCRTEGVAFGTSTDDLFAFETEPTYVKATYEQMSVERLRTKGIIMVEMDAHGQMLEQILNVFADMQPKDLWKPLIMTTVEPGKSAAYTVGAAETIFRSLVRCGMFTSGNGSLMSVLQNSNTTATYLPSTSYTRIVHFKAFGRFLCKCITDGNLFPPVLAPSLFKFILGLVPNIADLETYSPETAVQLRLKYANVARHGAGRSNMDDQVESILVRSRKPQLEAIRDGFLDASSTWLRPTSLTAFDLALLCHHQYAKHVVHSGTAERAKVVFRRCITFSGFPPDSVTPEHFWRWFDTLGPRGRCLFLWFATGRCGLILERESGPVLDALLDGNATASQRVCAGSSDRDCPLEEQRKRQTRASRIVSGSSFGDKEEYVAIQSSPYTTILVIHYCPLEVSVNPPSSPNTFSPTHSSGAGKVLEEDGKPPSPLVGPSVETTRRRGLSRSKGNPADLFSLAKAEAPPKYPGIQRVFAGEVELPDYRNLFVLTTQMAKAMETFLSGEKS